MKNKIVLSTVAALTLLLSACDDANETQQNTPPPVTFDQQSDLTDANERLLDAIRTKPVEGGKLIARPAYLYFSLSEGQQKEDVVRITNEGDAEVKVESLITTTRQRGLELGGSCNDLPTIAPGTSCDLNITYTNFSGRGLDTSVLMTTDSSRSPQVTINISIDSISEDQKNLKKGALYDADGNPVLDENGNPVINSNGNITVAEDGTLLDENGNPIIGANGEPIRVTQLAENSFNPTTPQGTSSNTNIAQNIPSSTDLPTRRSITSLTQNPNLQPNQQTTYYNPAHIAAIIAARAERTQSSFGHISSANTQTGYSTPQIIQKTVDTRYNPKEIPWTESTLPIDRKRILTADRVIKAVLETPITNVMCNKAVAVVDTHVFSPDGTNVLIPAGTRVIGRCQAFADERGNIQWERMITPTGVNISFKNLLADSADASGRGGIPGIIEQKFTDRYILPVISTSLDALSSIARALYGEDQQSTTNVDTGTSTSSKSSQDVALDEFNDRVIPEAQQIIRDIADVRKIAVIPGGTRFDIEIQEDIYFKTPYEVVRLNDVEYDINSQITPPVMNEQPAPDFNLQPTLRRPSTAEEIANSVVINGQRYYLQPAPQRDANGQPVYTGDQRSMASPPSLYNNGGGVNNQGSYVNPNGMSNNGQQSNYQKNVYPQQPQNNYYPQNGYQTNYQQPDISQTYQNSPQRPQ